MRKIFLPVVIALGLAGTISSPAAQASSAGPALERQSWPWDGLFGRYDKAALQRGFQVYHEVCAACHGLDHLAYRNLSEIGFTPEQVVAIAAEKEVTDGPDDNGEMFTRPARPSDRFVPPYPNEQAARAAQGGAYPPDLSLIIKARPRGADYVYNLLRGYIDEEQIPAYLLENPVGSDFVRNTNLYFNKHFGSGGFQIAMAPPLPLAEGITFADGTPNTPHQVAHDVVSFLNWAADPNLDSRKSLGLKVMLFLAILAVLAYALKRAVWARLEDH